MGYSLNVEHLIHMAIDAKNGHINQHFLVRLLEVIVRHSNLHKYYVNFDGDDKNRAQDVYTGMQDESKVPLNDEFSFWLDEEDIDPVKKGNKLVKEQSIVVQYENGENTSPLCFEKSVISEEFEEGQLNCNPIEKKTSSQDTTKMIMEQLEILTTRVNELQTLYKETAVIPLTTSNPDLDKLIKSDNSIRSCTSIESFEGSLQSIYSPPSVETISEPDENKKKILMPSSLNLNRFVEETHEYSIHNNDRNIVMGLIEKLFGELQKIDSATKLLKKSIKTINIDDDSFGSADNKIEEIAYSSDDVDFMFEMEKHGYDRLQHSENLKKLDISARGDVFINVIGRSRKRKELDLGLSIRDFHKFDLDYRTNFQTIHSFLMLFKEMFEKNGLDIVKLKKNSMNRNEVLVLKEAVLHIKKKHESKDYILKDREVIGPVQFINSETLRMNTYNSKSDLKTTKTQNVAKMQNAQITSVICNVHVPVTQNRRKEELIYKLDRLRQDNIRNPYQKDLIRMESLRKAFYKETQDKKRQTNRNQPKIATSIKNATICSTTMAETANKKRDSFNDDLNCSFEIPKHKKRS